MLKWLIDALPDFGFEVLQSDKESGERKKLNKDISDTVNEKKKDSENDGKETC